MFGDKSDSEIHKKNFISLHFFRFSITDKKCDSETPRMTPQEPIFTLSCPLTFTLNPYAARAP
jgi:hypothetical protein